MNASLDFSVDNLPAISLYLLEFLDLAVYFWGDYLLFLYSCLLLNYRSPSTFQRVSYTIILSSRVYIYYIFFVLIHFSKKYRQKLQMLQHFCTSHFKQIVSSLVFCRFFVLEEVSALLLPIRVSKGSRQSHLQQQRQQIQLWLLVRVLPQACQVYNDDVRKLRTSSSLISFYVHNR